MTLWWTIFMVFVLTMLALDLGVFNRKAHVIKVKEALLWTLFWVSLSMLFCLGIYYLKGYEKALEFLTAYLIEESLSIDNLFVFLLIFNYFGIPAKYEHKALFWGVLGALVMRGVFIIAGVALITKFHWIIYIFGALLIITAIKITFQKDKKIQPEKNPVLKLLHKIMPVDPSFDGGRFFLKKQGRWFATPLFAIVLVLETTDVIFAVDSIPAVLAISTDPFIVYTSNVFAILGLRSLFFAISGIMRLFHYLHYGLSIVLSFVGLKMLLTDIYKIPIVISLGTIATVLLLSILASILWPAREQPTNTV
jgi:tellurite resistance protein TerC